LPGPDHRASLEPDELADLVAAVRRVEAALGDGIKRPGPRERANRAIARKSIVAARPIRAGEPYTAANLATKRPGTGLSPMVWDEIVGTLAARDYDTDDLIER
jgi:N,N'-diacetyllegionaminate synthase